MKYHITHSITHEVMFTYQLDVADVALGVIAKAVEAAIKAKISLAWADLSELDLSGIDFTGVDLSNALLSYSNCSDADFTNANLSNAQMVEVSLYDANFLNANLTNANCTHARFHDTVNLGSANIAGVNFAGVDFMMSGGLDSIDLSVTNLDGIKADFFEIIKLAEPEIAGLRLALVEGRINGAVYEGECACLIGTIANIRSIPYTKLPDEFERDAFRPAERWFRNIYKGHTPQTNPVSRITVKWIDEFTAAHTKIS